MKGQRLFEKNGKTGCLLIHGLTSTTQELEGLFNFLHKKKYTVLATLLKGHNASIENLHETTWHDWYTSVERDFDFLSRHCDKIFVIGLSIGATLALHLAANKKTPKIKGMVLLAPAIFYVSPLIHLTPFLQHVKRYTTKDYSKYYPKRKKAFFDIADDRALEGRIAYKKAPLRALASALSLIKIVKKEIRKIKLPALIMHSLKDNTIKPKSAVFVYNQISTQAERKKLVYLKNSGHVITVDFDKELVFKEIYSFIRRNQ